MVMTQWLYRTRHPHYVNPALGGDRMTIKTANNRGMSPPGGGGVAGPRRGELAANFVNT